jgi:hypothetical protein
LCRCVKARGIPTREEINIGRALFDQINIMSKPDIISADNEIINAIFKRGVMYPEFTDIQPYRTSPDEINKNAIVERMIKL